MRKDQSLARIICYLLEVIGMGMGESQIMSESFQAILNKDLVYLV